MTSRKRFAICSCPLGVGWFKYPPHWISVERLWNAMKPVDPVTGRARGWLVMRSRQQGIALGFSLRCDGGSWQQFARRFGAVVLELGATDDVAELARGVLSLTPHLEVRTPSAAAHQETLAAARAALRALPLYERVESAVGPERAEAVALLLLGSLEALAPSSRATLAGLTASLPADSPLTAELTNLRAQVSALRNHARDAG